MSITATDPAQDTRFMTLALRLARRGWGRVWPSVSVGCLLVKDGAIIAQGWTQPGGRPHAEIHALHQAGEAARGATAYVTLEPCAHHGRAGPCCDALLAAGIARAVIAIEDPDPRTAGQGIARMRAGGVAVEVGLMADEAREVAAGFLLRLALGRPLVTAKSPPRSMGALPPTPVPRAGSPARRPAPLGIGCGRRMMRLPWADKRRCSMIPRWIAVCQG